MITRYFDRHIQQVKKSWLCIFISVVEIAHMKTSMDKRSSRATSESGVMYISLWIMLVELTG